NTQRRGLCINPATIPVVLKCLRGIVHSVRSAKSFCHLTAARPEVIFVKDHDWSTEFFSNLRKWNASDGYFPIFLALCIARPYLFGKVVKISHKIYIFSGAVTPTMRKALAST